VAVDDPSLVDERVWIEKRPEKLTDYVHGEEHVVERWAQADSYFPSSM
jgi:hypothetical protein